MDPISSAAEVVKGVTNCALKPGIKHVAYIVHYRQNVDELNDSVKRLERTKEKVEHQVDEAVKNLHNIEGKVIDWLQKVAEFKTKVEEFRKDEGHTKTRLSFCLFPYLRNRRRLGRKAKKMVAEDVKKLINESPKFDELAYAENVTYNDATLYNAGYVGFDCRKSTMEDIMAQLEDSTVRMIGLYGPGGVGKSTLIKEIAKKVRDKKLFTVVAISEITANPNPQKIQEDIAYVLGLRLEGEGENVRADCLRRRLKKEKENTLVILDDLWDRLDLNKLGIPLDGDDYDSDALMEVARIPDEIENQDDDNGQRSRKKIEGVKKEKSLGDYKGCKILLTSRDKKVLSDSDKMDVKSIFCVKELDDKDALMLFQKVAGIPHEMSISKQEMVKKYCAGLPMAIVTVGRALRDKSESVWEATLEKLKKQELVGVQNCMDISVKMSYDRLENEELKSIFLLCAQMGHQPLIMDLVKYCFGLGILEGVYSLREVRDRVDASIQKLKDSSLMLDGSSSNHFKMHDMVRDATLSIAHKEQNVYTLRNGKLDDWPDKDELERCTSISICNSDIIDELPKVINCPQLKFFQIDSNDPSLKIPEKFFEGMEKLRVLILIGFHLSSIQSIKSLSNLRMLCLERCTLDGDLSIIGELKKLRILSFSGSQIGNLTAELGCLDKLQLLDISNCSIVKVSPNVISRLTSLEELYIRKSLIKILAEGETNQSQISLLSELKHLHQLRVVDLCIPHSAVLPKDLFFDKLNDYKIVIGDIRTLSVGDFRMPNKYEAFRSLALQLKDGTIHSQKGIKLLFKRVENLLLGELNGVENVICELNLDGFPDLKHLSITDNTSIKYIINSKDLPHSQGVFYNLESLYLYKLWNIEMICRSPVTHASFTKLKTIKVKMCAHLKNLFSFSMIKFLSSLETIDVSECDSIKEIVEIPVGSDKVEFLNLHSLTLQQLPPLFTSFYDHSLITEAQTNSRDLAIAEDMAPPLFGKLVEIPNLESLNLSSVNIYKIWSDQAPSSFCFQNIIKLVVKDCNKLKYLCSLSVARGLRKLKGLTVSGCPIMEKIFSSEGNSADKVCVFPKLEEIHLSEMNTLADIWQAELSADSFSSLISVHIEKCGKLDKIFPSHMEGWFASLESLKVVGCMSVEVIFEIKDSQQIDASGGIDTNLQLILADNLPNLKQVWSRDPGGILNFKKLRSIKVSVCKKLRNVFPASVARDVPKLEYMSVWVCKRMVEIVACEDGLETDNEPLVFPELTFMELYDLSSMKHFYKGRCTIECPKLKRLEVDDYEKLKTFPTETGQSTNEKENPVFSAEEVIPNLEYMKIVDLDRAKKWLSRSNSENCRMHRLKELTLHSVKNADLLYWFLYRMPNLEKLSIWSGYLKELVPSANIATQERLRTILQLKELFLESSGIKDLGFEQEPLLQRLEHLSLKWCHDSSNLAPPSVSLTYLTYLEVNRCRGLRNLMASSTAKSLVQLKTMKVIDCDEIEQIVTNEGNEEDKMTEIEIVFSKLITIELVTLKRVTSFCTDKNCKFKFPSLEILIVRECPMMETFTESVDIKAPKLQNILAVEGEEEAKWQWEVDLNTTIKKVFKDKVTFTYTKDLYLFDYPGFVEQLWQGNHLVQQNCFRNLKRLTARRCKSLEHVIPSHLLPCFENLEELQVWYCRSVRVIFNINEMRDTKALGIIRLKRLSLIDLPKLEHVWDKDPEGIIGLQVLQDMRVKKCDGLKSLFPTSVAKDLSRLEELEVTECRELVEIFSKDEKTAEGATKEFVFSCLTTLRLKELPGLKHFYPGLHTLEWPVLEQLHAFHCELIKYQEDHGEVQVLIQIEKVIQMDQIPSLKQLSFGIGDTEVTWDPESGQLQFDRMQRFPEESDSGPLYRFLDMMLPRIENLAFNRCLFKEMFSAERPNADYTRIFLHLKGLEFHDMNDLNSIGLEHSWLHPFPENLQTLRVNDCGSLINLVPCAVSFSNLTYLEVSGCKSLKSLFATSTAKSLARLKRVKIKKCESLKEIVSREEDESPKDERIIFEQLQVLFLKKMDELSWFYPGNFTLHFPSLEEVYVIECRLMKTFSPFNKIDHSINWFSAEYATPQQKYCDLNSAASRTWEELFLESARSVSELSLRDSPLQEIWQWHSSRPIPNLFFSNLASLTVDGCQFLSDAVLPFNLLPFFTKLETLEVRNCDFVKTIFDVKCITQGRIMTFDLKNFTLLKLPNLENVWNEDPHGILSMKLLQQVSVHNCECLTSVFPASVAKDLVKLENLVVKDCEGLMTIVAEDNNADPRGTNLELTFPCPCVRSLELRGLPKFKYFYYCSLQCDILKTFTHLEPHTEDQVCIEKHKCLSLDEIGLEMILRGEFQRNLLHKLKVLTLFGIELDVFPYEILQQVPDIEKLVVRDGSFKDILCFQSPDVNETGLLSQLKVLSLESLSKLETIGSENSWVEPFLRNLETLQVNNCSSLINLVQCTVSFSNLTYLEVSGCENLLYLFTSSTAKSLAQLKRMEIKSCYSIETIVYNEGDESNEDEMIFRQLNYLNLFNLRKLRSFYKGSLNFPSLDQLSVTDCKMMETLCPGTLKADKLFEVKFQRHSDAIPMEIDLKSTMRKKFLARITETETAQQVSSLELRDSPLQEIWLGSLPIPDLCFTNLHSLIVDGCQFLSDAVLPSNLIPFLTKLETLEVRNCDSVKTVFDVKCITQDRIMCFSLKKLTLLKLPTLKNVWNEDPHGILSMQLLQQVYVDNCKCLTSVFPASVAKDIVKLEDLVVQHCEVLMAIVAEDNADQRGTNLEVKFPHLKLLTLWDLPKFNYNSICYIRDTTTLEHLTLGENEVKMIWRGQFLGNLLHKLQVLTLCFHIECDVFLNGFLHQVPNIEKLVVCSGSFKEIFCLQSPNVDDTGLLSQLKGLRLESLPELISIGSENSCIESFLRNLDTLEVISCFSSINLVPCTVSFSNLTYLLVHSCDSLLYLFTSSTAKSLAKLKKMEIKSCKSIKEIVSKEGDESHEDELVFRQLNCLNLYNLPDVRSFYKGSLSFPSMDQLSVIKCHRMESLCPGTIKADKLFEVIDQRRRVIPLEIDLKSTIREEFLARIPMTARRVSYLELGESPDLQEIWRGSLPIPRWCFWNLHSLIVDGCQFLSDAVLPSNLLHFLTKLETLEVRNCDSVKTVFDVKCITQDRIMCFSLKKLTLLKLPTLKNVWNEDPHGILSMQLLQQVYVDNCKCLTSVFPASVAKDLVKLEDLVVQHCEGLMAIVAEDNADPRGTNLELTFPCMTSLTLRGLPKFEFQVCIEKPIPNLQNLTLDEKILKMIWNGEFQGNLLHKLKVLTLCFGIELDVFPYKILQQVPNIEKLVICDGSFKEIFCFQSPNVDYTGFLSQVKVLSLESLSELETIGLENTMIETFLRNLETLDVSSCSCLTNMAPSPVCFPNLMCLFVFECNGLKNVFTSSTAKSLARLKMMEIKSCESIKEIVSMEEDGSHKDEITFWQLLYLNLESLPNLASFYTGSLSFPSLVQLSVINCHKMKNLCAGIVNAEKLFEVKFQKNSNAIPLEIDLNSTILKACQATEVSNCKLFLSSPVHRLVAHGKVYNHPDDTLHGRPLPDGHIKVSVDVGVELNAQLPVPIDDDIMTITQAIGTFVAWPMNLIKVDEVVPSLSKKKRTHKSYENESVVRLTNQKEKGKKVNRAVVGNNYQFLGHLNSHLRLIKTTDTINRTIDMAYIFGIPDYKEIIDREIILEVVNQEWLSATSICIYIGYLYNTFVVPEQKSFFFLSPQVTATQLQLTERVQRVVDILVKNVVIDKLVIMPFNTGLHWVLLAINFRTEIIYYLDPLYASISMRAEMKNFVDKVLQMHWVQVGVTVSRSKSNNIKWIRVKGPIQPNSNDCGYYVCRYMREIINNYEGMIPENYFSSCSCSRYLDHQINEIREEWCQHVIQNIL